MAFNQKGHAAPQKIDTPEATIATARDTAVVLRGLFASATTRVLLAGYSFSHAHDLLAPLHHVMKTRGAERNIEAGVLLRDARFAAHLARQWMGLIGAGHVLAADLAVP